ncbi:ATP-binding protein, partial [Candidatus Bipolaricaulota bacterium]|nr:ATP-binding protein [Candidatus Bipolaricaulota bacterium]
MKAKTAEKKPEDEAIATTSSHEVTPRTDEAVALICCSLEPPAEHTPTSPEHSIEPYTPSHGFSSIGQRFRDYVRLMEERGITPAPTPHLYNCPLCHDAGYVHPTDKSGHVDYSSVVPCTGNNCAVARYRQYRRGEEAAHARGVRSPKQTFETFEPRDGSKQAFNYARQLADGSATFIWLLVFGGTGNGKSHLCNAMARESIRRGVDTRLVSVADLFAAL